MRRMQVSGKEGHLWSDSKWQVEKVIMSGIILDFRLISKAEEN